MGEHKYNPTAQEAKEGLLPPMPEEMFDREYENRLMLMMQSYLSEETGLQIGRIAGSYFKMFDLPRGMHDC